MPSPLPFPFLSDVISLPWGTRVGLPAGPLWLPGQALAGEGTLGGTLDVRCWANFPLVPPPAFSPLPPPSRHTSKDSLEAEVTQGFQN